MFVEKFAYHVKEGVRSIFTHGLMSFAASCMIVACLLIMGSFSLVAVNASHMLGDLEKDNEFLAYVDEDYTEEQAKQLQGQLDAIENIDSAVFVTRQEALDQFRGENENGELFEDLPAEVLRDRYRIHVVDIEQMADTVEQVEALTGIARVQASLEIADGFVMVSNVASALAIILIVMLVIISVFIISNTIRLTTFSRREEIAIMKMCGATNWFVRWPFLIEGIVLGLVGSLVAFFCEWGVYSLIARAMENSGILSIISMVPFASLAVIVLAVFLLVGFLIGAGGSALAIHRFLKV